MDRFGIYSVPAFRSRKNGNNHNRCIHLVENARGKTSKQKAFKYIYGITGITCRLIVTENLSTAVSVCGSVFFFMMFVGRVPLQQLGLLAGYRY